MTAATCEAKSSVRDTGNSQSNGKRLKQPIDLALAVGEGIEVDADFVEHCQVEVGERDCLVILDVTPAFHSTRRTAGDQNWQVGVVMNVRIPHAAAVEV